MQVQPSKLCSLNGMTTFCTATHCITTFSIMMHFKLVTYLINLIESKTRIIYNLMLMHAQYTSVPWYVINLIYLNLV
jgi:hypothetical protein